MTASDAVTVFGNDVNVDGTLPSTIRTRNDARDNGFVWNIVTFDDVTALRASVCVFPVEVIMLGMRRWHGGLGFETRRYDVQNGNDAGFARRPQLLSIPSVDP